LRGGDDTAGEVEWKTDGMGWRLVTGLSHIVSEDAVPAKPSAAHLCSSRLCLWPRSHHLQVRRARSLRHERHSEQK
jgi:hypothetical protein